MTRGDSEKQNKCCEYISTLDNLTYLTEYFLIKFFGNSTDSRFVEGEGGMLP